MGSWRAVVRITQPDLGGVGTNTWHLRDTSTDPSDTSELDALMTLVLNFYGVAKDSMPDDAHIAFDGVFSGILGQEGDTRLGDTWSADGALTGGCAPPSQCIVVGWKANTGGRSGRGRTFIGPIGLAVLDLNGTPKPANMTAIRTAAQELVDESTGYANGALCIFSRTDNLMRDITVTQTRDIFAVLRSRRD